MKKVVILIFTFAIMFMGVGCEKKAEYEFLQDVSEINTIEIVKIGVSKEGEEIIPMTSISIVNDKENFLREFLQINCYCNPGDPQGVVENAKVIKVIYNNGEFELIDVGGQSTYTLDRQYKHYAGFRYFDDNEFNELISKYCGR